MKSIISNNGIYLVYIFSQLIILFFSFQKDEIIGETYNFSQALAYHFLIIVLISIGYSIRKIVVFRSPLTKLNCHSFKLKKGFYFLCLVLILIGVLTSVLTIGSIVSPQEFLSQLIAMDAGIAEIRQQSGDGGLGGIFKMLNYSPLAVYLITSSFLIFYDFNEDDSAKIKKINFFALIGAIIKVFFSLDRLTIMAILLVQLYTNMTKKKIKLNFLLVIGAVLFTGSFITASRMDGSSFFDFLIVYFKLSIVNFQIVIDHHKELSYGMQTFLSPLYFIGKFFGIELIIAAPIDYVWNPAQYFNSYLFMDFGFISFFIYPFIGYFINYIELRKKQGSKFFTSSYFVFMFAFTTFVSVPFIRGIEFWLVIFISILVSKLVGYREVIPN
jgi:hypothetical protein